MSFNINNKYLTVIALLFILIATACNDNTGQVNKVVNDFFTGYKSDFRVADKNLITKVLSEKIDSAIIKEKYEAKRLKDMHSTDKPLMIEGDIFTSIYEGYTSFKIKSTSIQDDKASVILTLENKYYKLNWENEVQLIKENNSWKLDDVLFTDNKGGGASTKDVLNQFLRLKAD